MCVCVCVCVVFLISCERRECHTGEERGWTSHIDAFPLRFSSPFHKSYPETGLKKQGFQPRSPIILTLICCLLKIYFFSLFLTRETSVMTIGEKLSFDLIKFTLFLLLGLWLNLCAVIIIKVPNYVRKYVKKYQHSYLILYKYQYSKYKMEMEQIARNYVKIKQNWLLFFTIN